MSRVGQVPVTLPSGVEIAIAGREVTAKGSRGSLSVQIVDEVEVTQEDGALGVAALAYAYARRHASDRRFSFGTGKVGALAGFASALVLAVIAIGIGVESMLRMLQPVTVAFGEATIIAIAGLGVNLASAALLAGSHSHDHGHGHGHGHGDHHHDHDGGRDQDNNQRAAYVHVLADALTSVLAITALLAGRYLGWVWLDPVMGIVGAIVIARWSVSLMRDTAWMLLDRTDDHVADEIRELIETPGDARIADLHVWRIGPDAHAGIVSVIAGPNVARATVERRLGPVHELRHLPIDMQPA